MTQPRVVFDTNVLLSAVGWNGNPLRCLLLARAGTIQGLTCAEILDEVYEKAIEKLGRSPAEAFAILDELREFLQMVTITGALQGVALHPSDDKVIECALVGNATYIVTGDRKHLLPIRSFRGIQIVSPTELLEQLV